MQKSLLQQHANAAANVLVSNSSAAHSTVGTPILGGGGGTATPNTSIVAQLGMDAAG